MVCVTRSSSKHEGAEAEDTIPPVRTRGRASTSRNATSTRRSRRTSAVEDSSNDAGATQGSEMSDQASTGTESQRNSASPNPLTSTPSRRLRRKRGSETGSCGSSTSITDLQETSNTEKPESETSAGSAVQETPNAGKPPASPSRRRRGSSSSSQAAVTPSPARITRAMRKAGISTPKDVVELEIVPEEESTEERVSKSDEKERKERNSPVKSPAGKKSMSPSKDDNDENAAKEVTVLGDEHMDVTASPDRKSASRATEVASPERKQATDRTSTSPLKNSPAKRSTPETTTSPARMEPEEAEKPSTSPSKKSPVKDVTSKDVLDSRTMDALEQTCRSPVKKSPMKEVSPVKAALSEGMEVETDLAGSAARKSPSKRKSLTEAASPEASKERSSPVKGSPVKEVTPEALPEIVPVEANSSNSSGKESASRGKSPKKIAAPEPVDLEAEFGMISPRKTISDEVTPVKTIAARTVDLEADPMRSPTKKSPVTEVSPKNVLHFEDSDYEEIQPIESPQRKSPKKVLSPQKHQPEELTASSPGGKSPRKAETSPVLASEMAEDEPLVTSTRKSPREDVVLDVTVVEERNIEEEGSVSHVKKTKESPMKEKMEVSGQDGGGLTISPKHNQSPSKPTESAAPEPTVSEESEKKSKGKKLKKGGKKVLFAFFEVLISLSVLLFVLVESNAPSLHFTSPVLK
ncbi:hypothetical protein Aduo_010199 [Ancylostoma duodenale]